MFAISAIRKCTIVHCSSYLGTNQLKGLIINSFLERYSDDDSICYMQWDNTDCCYLIEHELDFEDFIDEFITKFVNLMPHHYIAEHPSIFFKSCKENLQLGEGVLILDFAKS